jgi:3-methyladenine DNA glycosylase AlkD
MLGVATDHRVRRYQKAASFPERPAIHGCFPRAVDEMLGRMPKAPSSAVRFFRARFSAAGTAERAAGAKAYMKSDLWFFGVDAAELRAASAAFCKEVPLDGESLRAVARELFATDWFELRSVAIALLERKRKLLEAVDAPWLIELVRASPCWAHVDFLVTKVIDPLVVANPKLLPRVRSWAQDEDFWVRRTALLAQLGPLRRGGGDFALFAEVAAPMLVEKEFFIRKAIGWVLREVSKKRQALVRDFLLEHGARASGLTWREATKYLPPGMQRELARVRA